MKNIKCAILFLLLSLIGSFSCQSFGNFGAGFVINIQGDFDKDILVNGSFIGSCNIKNIKCTASVSLNNNGTIQKSITILPQIKNEQPTANDIAIYSAAITTGALLNQYVITSQKNQNKIRQLNAERKTCTAKREQLDQANLEEQKRARNKIVAYLNQKTRI